MKFDIEHCKKNEFRREEQKLIFFFLFKGSVMLHILAAETSPK